MKCEGKVAVAMVEWKDKSAVLGQWTPRTKEEAKGRKAMLWPVLWEGVRQKGGKEHLQLRFWFLGGGQIGW
jgi:hypothetical protein